jgi:hypothetical protein
MARIATIITTYATNSPVSFSFLPFTGALARGVSYYRFGFDISLRYLGQPQIALRH